MGIRLYNGRILHRNCDGCKLYKEDLFCDEGKIVEISHSFLYHNYDMSGKCILPSFFNMHSHLGESLYYDSISGDSWTIGRYLAYTEKLNSNMNKLERDALWNRSAVISVNEMMKKGTVGFCAARSAAIASKMGLLTMSGYPIMNSVKLSDFKIDGLRKFKAYYEELNAETCSVGIFLHSVYANDERSLRLAADCMNEGAEYITVHVSEDFETYLLEKKTYGISAVETLDKYGLLNSRTLLVHCGFCSDEDFELIKERGAIVCVCPISNHFLNTKMPDLYMLESKGIPWCIASDGLSTGRTFSLLEQIKEAKKVYPLISYDRYFDSITYIPGVFFQKESYNGTLSAGVNSSVVIVDYDTDDFDELISNLIYGKIKYQFMRY
ncbi:MAG: amidohydrolase family protein [Odoribacter sp.]|nr:amidohydrolase family protein [Odoribacter sp.]